MTVVLDYGPAGLAPGGVDVAIECAGVAETVRQSTRLAKSGGTVVILGVMPQGEKIEIEPFDILLPDLRVLGSFINPFVHRRAADLVASGAIEIDKLISRRASLDEAAAVITHAPADGEVKIMVMPGGI
ncbi:threonine dehydrogenase-like Zn-dependent dehydrogenase [Ensifer sp. 4252]